MWTKHDSLFLLVEKFCKLSTPLNPRRRSEAIQGIDLDLETFHAAAEMAKTAKIKKKRTAPALTHTLISY